MRNLEEAMIKSPSGTGETGPRKLLTLIMPARNEEANLPRAYDEVTAVMAALPLDYEVLIIDNDSNDRTGEVAAGLCSRDRRWRYVKFSRNFTVEASIAAGLRFARGDAALVLFSDLQDPPRLIPEFVRKWDEGYDVVYGQLRHRHGDPWWKAWSARLVYRVINRLADVEIPANATDFRLLSRRAIYALNQLRERNRYIRGCAHWIGFRQCALSYDRRPRTAGNSKAPLFYLFNLAVNAVTCFSIKPLQIFSYAGALAFLGTVCLGLVFLASYLFAFTVPGLTTMYLLSLANLAVLLLGFGTLGEYVGRIYVESKRRPLFIVDRTINMDGMTAEARESEGMTAAKHTPAVIPSSGHPVIGSPRQGVTARRRFDPRELRKTILHMAYTGSTVHVACALCLVEVLAVLYCKFLHLDPGRPDDPDRDYLVLSKGHGVMAQYACLRELGWLSDADIQSYFRDGTRLKGLCDAHVPGVEVSSGSLGHGLSVGVGLALAAKRRHTRQRCFAIIGDGEMNEGSVWEALLFAAHFELDNLVVIVDANGYQAMGTTTEVMDLGSIAGKLRAFGFETREVAGHDERALEAVLAELLHVPSSGPRALIAHTVKGKGISFMEGDNRWHYTRLDQRRYAAAVAELQGGAQSDAREAG
jgi:transketolase